MKEKIYKYSALSLLIILVGLVVYYKSAITDLETQNLKETEKAKELAREERDKAIKDTKKLLETKDKKIDSLKKVKNEIIKKPYIKYVYRDLTYDRAFDVLSEARYNERQESNNSIIERENN